MALLEKYHDRAIEAGDIKPGTATEKAAKPWKEAVRRASTRCTMI
jgi:hypothetical protein